MFCDQCGTPSEPTANFCTRCGKSLSPVIPSPSLPQTATAYPLPTAPAVSRGQVRRHLPLLAVFWILYAAIRLVGVFWLFAVGRVFIPSFITAIISLSQPIAHRYPFGWLVSQSLGILTAWIAFWAALELIAAWGLLERAAWARLLVLILAVLSLFRFPLGSLLGIYTLWVMLPGYAAAEYAELSRRG
jgi:hypothetical protein